MPMGMGSYLKNTPWMFNIAPENIRSQKETNIPTIINHPFLDAMLVSGRVLYANQCI